MARKKYATKRGTASPSAEVGGGAGSRSVGAGVPAPAAPVASVGSRAEPPTLGPAVMSSWGWRILAVFTMVALGLTITFALDGHTAFALVWFIITAGWGFFTVVLWRRHLAWDLSYAAPPRKG
jgi:hypothetical protein